MTANDPADAAAGGRLRRPPARHQPVSAPSPAKPEATSRPQGGRLTGAGEALALRVAPTDEFGLQRTATADGPPVAPPSVHSALSSPGHALDPGSRAHFESRLGHDFGAVRLHTDPRAAESARAVNALAYTVGRDIVFAHDGYRPGTAAGRRLLGHELGHVVQQSAASTSVPARLPVAPAASELERAADRAADASTTAQTPALDPRARSSAPVAVMRQASTAQPATTSDEALIEEAKAMIQENRVGPEAVGALLRKFAKGRVGAPQRRAKLLPAMGHPRTFEYIPPGLFDRPCLSVGNDFVDRVARGDLSALASELAVVVLKIDAVPAPAAAPPPVRPSAPPPARPSAQQFASRPEGHELAEAVQPGATAPAQSSGTPGATKPAVGRRAGAPTDASVMTDLKSWATQQNVVLDEKSDSYPTDLWAFVASLIQDPSGAGPIPPPTDKAKLAAWTMNLEKAEIVAGWLLSISATSKSDTAREAAASRAASIMLYIAESGLISKAMAHAGALSADKRTLLYTTVLATPGKASASELQTIVASQCAGSPKPKAEDVPVVKALVDGNPNDLKKLDADRTKAIFAALIAAYPADDTIVDAIAEVLLFNPKIRPAISEAMMASAPGSPALLFKVLKHPIFVEPGYRRVVPAKATEPTMKADMPWVYKYKQKIYVQYLIDLAQGQGIPISAPAAMSAVGLRTWLQANTEQIAAAAAKRYPTDTGPIFEIYRNIADIFFFHVPHAEDITPDPSGHIRKLVPGEPSKARLKADCDVFATYAMRLMSAAGLEAIGYIDFVPDPATKRRSHTAAVVRKDGSYSVINNKGILDTGVKDNPTAPGANKLAALKAARKLAQEDAYEQPFPPMTIYYADALAKGRMPDRFVNRDPALVRTDLN